MHSHSFSVNPTTHCLGWCSVYEYSHLGVLGFASWFCADGAPTPHTHTQPLLNHRVEEGALQVSMCFCLSYRSDLATLSPHSHSCRISENTSSSNFSSNKETESEVRTLQLVSLVFLTTKLMAFTLLQYESIKKCSAETTRAQH